MPMARASGRGKIPRILMNGQAAAYSSRCRILWLIAFETDAKPALLRCVLRPLRQGCQERIRSGRRLDLPDQRRPEGHHAAIKFPRAVFVLLDHGPIQTHAGEEPARPRV